MAVAAGFLTKDLERVGPMAATALTGAQIHSQEAEEWRPVLGFEAEYEASSLGRIRSKQRPGTLRPNHIYGGKVLAENRSGPRALVTLSKNNEVTTKSIHKMVCEAFHGPRPPDKDVAAHWDGDEWNNRADNLRWATWEENEEDKRRHDRHSVGLRNPGAKLTPEAVADIRRRHTFRYGSGAALAREFGVSTTQICDIVHEKCWSEDGAARRRARRAAKKEGNRNAAS